MRMSARLVPAVLLALAPSLFAASRIVVPEAAVQMGAVAKGEQIRHTFVIRNEGATDLHVSDVRPSCGCTAAEFDRVVAPGKEGRATLVVETKSFQGPISKSAILVSDDPASPQIALMISATVKPVVEVLPGGFLRIQAIAGEKVSAEATLVSEEPGFSPANPRVPMQWMRADVTPVPEKERLPNRGSGQFRLRVTADAGAPEGLVGGTVKLATGIARLPEMEIPLAGFVRPAVSVSTGRIHFQNFVPGGEPIRRTVLFTNNDPRNEAFALTAASVTVPGISAQIVPLDRQRVQVVLTVDPRIREGDFDGGLTVRTNEPKKGEIRLPISGSVLPREPRGVPRKS